MNAAALLDRLDGVRACGPGRWIARCPAHEDRSPSLSIRELDDGRVLIHDFAGCAATDVLASVGLMLTDLFPARLNDHMPQTRDRRHWHAAREALQSLDRDALLIAIAAENLAAGIALDEADRALIVAAAARCREAREVACGPR